MVARLGLEPRQTVSETVVLPLHNRAVIQRSRVFLRREPLLVNSHWHQNIEEGNIALDNPWTQIVRKLHGNLIIG